MTKQFSTVVVVAAIVTTLLMSKTAADSKPSWCQQDLGCDCSKLDDRRFVCRASSVQVGWVTPPSETNPDWVLECKEDSLKNIARANLTLGKVKRLHLEFCDVAGVSLAELFRSMNIEGLLQLSIFKTPRLESGSFRGFELAYPEFHHLDLESVDYFDVDSLRPLSLLDTLTFHSCERVTSFPEDFLQGQGNLKFFQVRKMNHCLSLLMYSLVHQLQSRVLGHDVS